MPLTMPADTGGDFVLVPEGTHPGRCYRVIDLGTQDGTFGGEPTRKHLVMLTWELPSKLMDDGRPMSASKRYTFSSHEKANLRKDLESWRGRRFEQKDFGPGGFEIKNVLNAACLLTITHAIKPTTTYANVDGVAKLVDGMQVPPLVNAPLFLGLTPDTWDQAVFAQLSEKLQEMIRKAPEFQQLHSGQPATQARKAVASEDDMDDEIPF